jgi:hypothetical protein
MSLKPLSSIVISEDPLKTEIQDLSPTNARRAASSTFSTLDTIKSLAKTAGDTLSSHAGSTFKDEDAKEELTVTKKEAVSNNNPLEKLTLYERYWALGNYWWKQIFDGKFHRFGPAVFDNGLHKREQEEGFYDSINKACRYASEALLKSSTNKDLLEVYLEIHRIACSHFQGKKNNTAMMGKEAGKFMPGTRTTCYGKISNLFDGESTFSLLEYMKFLNCYLEVETDYLTLDLEGQREWQILSDKTHEEIIAEADTAKKYVEKWDAEIVLKISKLNEYISKRSKDLGLSHPAAVVERGESSDVKITYLCTLEEANAAMRRLFKDFETNIAKAKTKEEALELVADLFQMSEWIHPYLDGQGRADLVLMSVLLTKYGWQHPSILWEPYASTFFVFTDWVKTLKTGMLAWDKEYRSVSSKPIPDPRS